MLQVNPKPCRLLFVRALVEVRAQSTAVLVDLLWADLLTMLAAPLCKLEGHTLCTSTQAPSVKALRL